MLVHALALNLNHEPIALAGLIRAGRRHARFARGVWFALWFRHQQWVLCLATLHYLWNRFALAAMLMLQRYIWGCQCCP